MNACPQCEAVATHWQRVVALFTDPTIHWTSCRACGVQLTVANERTVVLIRRWTVGVLAAAAVAFFALRPSHWTSGQTAGAAAVTLALLSAIEFEVRSRLVRLRALPNALLPPRRAISSPRVRLVVWWHSLVAAAFVVAAVIRSAERDAAAWGVCGVLYAVVAALLARGTRLMFWAAIAMATTATVAVVWFAWGGGAGTNGAEFLWVFVVLGPAPLVLLVVASLTESITMSVHAMLEEGYEGGVDELARRLDEGVDLEERVGALQETPLMIATRRRRLDAVELLVDRGAAIDAVNVHGKTSYAHAVRRTFDEVAEALAARGADTTLAPADHLAVHLANGELDAARAMLADDSSLARTGNPEEDRLLADLAGRGETAPVALLIEAGADLSAPALDGASALHQAAWFGQPDNARQLIAAGAPVDLRCTAHGLTPLGWACHGARYSGGAEERRDVYVELVRMILEAGGAPDAATSEGRKEVAALFAMSTADVRAVLSGAGLEPGA